MVLMLLKGLVFSMFTLEKTMLLLLLLSITLVLWTKYWCPSHVTHYEMEVLRAVCNGQRQPQRSPPIGGSIEPLRGGAASLSARRTTASGSLRGRHR